MNSMTRLSGKRAVITGADRGIGASIARQLVLNGASVCLNIFGSVDECKELVEELGASVFQADVRDVDAISGLFVYAERQLGGIDILVNNAGVESIVSALDLTVQEWDRIHQTDLRGSFFCSQAAAKQMKRQQLGGVIINISSMHDQVPRLGTAHYSSAKAGLSMLTKSLAHEWAEHGIRVVGIAPGAIETEINREQIEAFGRARFEEWIPLGYLGTVEDVANAVVFLASEEARYVSGTTLLIDGAYSLSTVRYDPRQKP